VSSRLTEEAVRSLLAMTGFIEPLYFQSDDERRSYQHHIYNDTIALT
jgi:hypothetical protein